jgi:hypothetical protein
MRSQYHTFFYLVAGDSAVENYLSRLFQASFANSLSFRRIALNTIWNSCSLPMPVPGANDWECDYQPSTVIAGGGRPDLCLRPPKDGNWRRPIFLESKVGSHLGETQLKKYKKHGAQLLIAVTKNRPEVSPQRLEQLRVKTLRWQDLCRALRQTTINGPREQFICQSFAEFLEETGMAYREDLTKAHLEEVGVMLRKIAAQKDVDTTLGSNFNYAHNCTHLLRDVRDSVLEQLPKLAQWTAWGPGYLHAFEEGWHGLAFSLTPNRWRKGKTFFTAGFYFYDDGPDWEVYAGKYRVDVDHENSHSIESVSSRVKRSQGTAVKALDADKMAGTIIEAARKWHIV